MRIGGVVLALPLCACRTAPKNVREFGEAQRLVEQTVAKHPTATSRTPKRFALAGHRRIRSNASSVSHRI